jgi:hypothetical protein
VLVTDANEYEPEVEGFAPRKVRFTPDDVFLIMLFLVQLALSWGALWIIRPAPLSYDRCATQSQDTCDSTVGISAMQVVSVGVFAFLGIVVIWSVVQFLRQRSRMWVPLVGIGGVVGITFLGLAWTFTSST